MGTFTIRQVIEHEVEEGWGAWFSPIYSGDGDDRIAEVDADVVRIAPDTVREFGGAICVVVDGGTFGVPVDLFIKGGVPLDHWSGDTHDLRDRFFHNKENAERFVARTLERFNNPDPWESFVRVA